MKESLIPLRTFLHRPQGAYPHGGEAIVQARMFQPRRGSQAVRIQTPLDWETDAGGDRNFRMQLHGWTMFHPVMNVFDSLRDKRAAVDYLLEVAADWWSRYRDDPDDVVTSRTPDSYAWYDMSVGVRALILAFFSNRISYFRIDLPSEEWGLLREICMKHVRHLRNPKVLYPNNHGIFQLHGLRALAETWDYPENQRDRQYAEKAMASLMRQQFDGTGVHREHSPHYHIFAVKTFEDVAASGWYDDVDGFREVLRSARKVTPWLVDPLKRPAAVGDSTATVQEDVEVPADQVDADLLVSAFGSAGYQVIRSQWSTPADEATYLFFTGAYHSKTHKHRDCLSFEWFEAGHKRLVDSGKYGYFADDIRRYVLSARAHNTVEIEGLDILRMSPYGSAVRSCAVDSNGICEVRGELNFRAIRHLRRLFLNPGKWIVVADQLSFNRRRTATQWFHVGLGHEFVRAYRSGAMFRGPDDKELWIETTCEESELVIHRGDTAAWQGFVSEKDDHVEPGFAVGYRLIAESASILSVVALGCEELTDARRFAGELLADEGGDREPAAMEVARVPKQRTG